MPALTCSVITPEAQVFDGAAESVVVPAHDGEIGILFNRAPLLAKLGRWADAADHGRRRPRKLVHRRRVRPGVG